MKPLWPTEDHRQTQNLGDVFEDTSVQLGDRFGLVRFESLGLLIDIRTPDGRSGYEVLRSEHPEEWSALMARWRARCGAGGGSFVVLPERDPKPIPPDDPQPAPKGVRLVRKDHAEALRAAFEAWKRRQ